jgi:hypothetical protein
LGGTAFLERVIRAHLFEECDTKGTMTAMTGTDDTSFPLHELAMYMCYSTWTVKDEEVHHPSSPPQVFVMI